MCTELMVVRDAAGVSLVGSESPIVLERDCDGALDGDTHFLDEQTQPCGYLEQTPTSCTPHCISLAIAASD